MDPNVFFVYLNFELISRILKIHQSQISKLNLSKQKTNTNGHLKQLTLLVTHLVTL